MKKHSQNTEFENCIFRLYTLLVTKIPSASAFKAWLPGQLEKAFPEAT